MKARSHQLRQPTPISKMLAWSRGRSTAGKLIPQGIRTSRLESKVRPLLLRLLFPQQRRPRQVGLPLYAGMVSVASGDTRGIPDLRSVGRGPTMSVLGSLGTGYPRDRLPERLVTVLSSLRPEAERLRGSASSGTRGGNAVTAYISRSWAATLAPTSWYESARSKGIFGTARLWYDDRRRQAGRSTSGQLP